MPSRATITSLATLAWRSARMVSSSSSGLSSTSSIVFSAISCLRDRCVRCESEEERGALALRRVPPDAPAMAVDDALHGRQADARPRELLLRMQPLESTEQLVRVRHIEAYPVVANEVGRALAVPQAPDLDARMLRLGGELPGVGDQVFKRRAQEPGIGLRLHVVPHGDFDIARRLPLRQLRDGMPGEIAQVDLELPQFAARHLGQRQQVQGVAQRTE